MDGILESSKLAIQLILALVLVIAAIYLWVRFGLRLFYPGAGQGVLQVIERLPLDLKTGSALYLVRLEEQLFLIGVSQGGVTLIKELPPGCLDKLPQQYRETNRPPLPFSAWLNRFRQGEYRKK